MVELFLNIPLATVVTLFNFDPRTSIKSDCSNSSFVSLLPPLTPMDCGLVSEMIPFPFIDVATGMFEDSENSSNYL